MVLETLFVFAIISMIIYYLNSEQNTTILATTFSLGFLYALLQGMIYKIIPFLAWFHLSSKGHFSIPYLRQYIDESMIKIQFFIYMASVVFFVISSIISPIFLYIGAGLFVVSNLILLLNLIIAVKKYNEIAKKNPMDAFG